MKEREGDLHTYVKQCIHKFASAISFTFAVYAEDNRKVKSRKIFKSYGNEWLPGQRKWS